MMYSDQQPGQKKQDNQRQPAIEPRGKTYKCICLFPSTNENGDLSQGLSNGIFKGGKVFGIEGVSSRKAAVAKFLEKKAPGSTLIRKNLEDIRFGDYGISEGEIDYFGSDTCGNFTAPVAHSMYLNQKYFADGMRFPLTLSVVNRNNGVEKALSECIDNYNLGDYDNYVEKKLKGTIFTIPFGMSKDLKRNLYIQIYMLLLSMPSKQFVFHRVTVYKNDDVSNMASHMVFIDITLHNCETDVRRENKLHRILHAFGELFPSKQNKVQVRVKKTKKTKSTKVATIPFHIQFGFKNREDMQQPWNKARITRLARQIAKDTGRQVQEVKGSMIAGINRHFTEMSKAQKKVRV